MTIINVEIHVKFWFVIWYLWVWYIN